MRNSDFCLLLPDEIILEIFKNLNAKDLFAVAKVCKRFSNLSLDHKLWVKLNLKNLKICENTFISLLNKGVSQISLRHCLVFKLSNPYVTHQCTADAIFSKNEIRNLSMIEFHNSHVPQKLFGCLGKVAEDVFELRFETNRKFHCCQVLPEVVNFLRLGTVKLNLEIDVAFMNCWRDFWKSCDNIKNLEVSYSLHSKDSKIFPYPSGGTRKKNLRVLKLRALNENTRLHDSEICNIVETCPRLRELTLVRSPEFNVWSLKVISLLNNLTYLNICGYGGDLAETLLYLNNIKNLKTLVVDEEITIPRGLKAKVIVQKFRGFDW